MSIIDANKYRINKEDIRFFTKSAEESLNLTSLASIATQVPVIIVCVYVGEIYGFSPELLKRISKLKRFYRINQIINIKSEEHEVL